MTTTYRHVPASCFALAWLAVAPAVEGDAVRVELANGLRAAFHPVTGTNEVVLVVLFDVGEDDDPAGQSGLGHFVEHVYVSAAAGVFGPRTVDDLITRYGANWNAQTGADYTVFSAVFPKDRLEEELTEAAARMGELHITRADLDRERPRMLDEVENMFGGIPATAITNWAREAVRPTLHGGRRGGLPEHIKAIELESIHRHWLRYYKPVNARLVLCGAIEVEQTDQQVRKHFGRLPPGEKLPPRPKREPPSIPREVRTHTIKPKVPGVDRYAALAFPAPNPDSEHYAAFLVLVSRLWRQSAEAGFECRIQYTPLDDPVFLAIVAPMDESSKPDDVLARLDAFLKDVVRLPLASKDIETARRSLAAQLGTAPISNSMLTTNLYGTAFALARRDQMGIDPLRLVGSLDELREQHVETAASFLFGRDQLTAIVISANND